MSHVDDKINIPQGRTASEFSLVELVNLFAQHRRLIIGLPVAVALIAAIASFMLPNVYRTGAKLLPPQQAQSGAAALLSQLGGAASVAAGMAGVKSPNDLYIGMLKSRTIADAVIAKHKLKEVYDTDSQEEARKILAENSFISAGKDGFIIVEVEDESQERVAPLANTYVSELMKMTRVLALTEASQRRMFFEQQLKQAKDNLASAEMRLKRALDSRGVISVDSQSRAMVETVGKIRAQISVKESQLGSMRAFVTASNPEFRRVEEEVKSLRNELGRLENGDGSAGGGGGQVGLENIKILRDVKYYQMLYELLGKQFEVARLDEAKDAHVIQVLDSAVAPERKFKPKRALIVILCFALALFATISWVFLRNSWHVHVARSKAATNPALRGT